jgi:CRISPR-associated protein Csm3
VDAPIIRDPLTGRPYIPASAFRGKLRWLLERSRFDGSESFFPPVGEVGGLPIRVHTCGACPICRLFGSVPRQAGEPAAPAQLQVEDLTWITTSSVDDSALERLVEAKAENAVDRGTGAANPRFLERVVPGFTGHPTRFRLGLRYQVREAAALGEDLEQVLLALSLLEDDAVGGHGSRGSGAVMLMLQTLTARALGYYGVPLAERPRHEEAMAGGPWRPAALLAQWPSMISALERFFAGE